MATAYAAEHRQSVEAKFAEPKGLGQLLGWLLREWAAEVPDTMHVPGVWRDYVRGDEDRAAVGGSLLGSPAMHGGFRAYTENSPRQVDQDGTIARPMHHALMVMAGNTSRGWPFMARLLFEVACSGGDWEGAGVRRGWTLGEARFFVEQSLVRLYRIRYDPR